MRKTLSKRCITRCAGYTHSSSYSSIYSKYSQYSQYWQTIQNSPTRTLIGICGRGGSHKIRRHLQCGVLNPKANTLQPSKNQLFLFPGTPPLPPTPPKRGDCFHFVCQSHWSFRFLADFLPNQQLIKKHILSKPHKISKNSTMGAQWLDFDEFGGPFRHPLFIEFRSHPNLLKCNFSIVKLVFYQIRPLNFGIESPLKFMFS